VYSVGRIPGIISQLTGKHLNCCRKPAGAEKQPDRETVRQRVRKMAEQTEEAVPPAAAAPAGAPWSPAQMRRFEGQAAIVTGGVGGLGKAIVQRLATEGATVCIFDMDEEAMARTVEEFTAEGLQVQSRKVDVTAEASVKENIEAFAAAAGRLDIMVNSAGIIGPNNHKITEVEMADFDATIAVNLRGSYLMTKHSLVEMEKRNYGRVPAPLNRSFSYRRSSYSDFK
jgi:D-arabinose 1-dehydrogenase-like Zn-dependent alcohol dehydrogenase